MKQINKFFISSVASFFILGQAVAEQHTIDKAEIQAELSAQLNKTINAIDSQSIEAIAKNQLDEMTLRQNVEQFLILANYNEETKSVRPIIITE